MAVGNKTIGRFQLAGIPPSQRGMPQIEVAFDIDADGILHVSAKDKATGKEQKIVIQASSGISDEEIKRMVTDAEEFKDADKKQREKIDIRNAADSLVYQTEKNLSEYKDRLDEADAKNPQRTNSTLPGRRSPSACIRTQGHSPGPSHRSRRRRRLPAVPVRRAVVKK
jgi:molecular chaperone DnaK